MKTSLDKTQSQHLIDLGVPKEKASETELYNDPSSWVKKVAPIFKLEDFLNGEILPKEIKAKGDVADLCFDWDSGVKRWCAGYAWLSEENSALEKELIDALYELACWYYGEYLKSEKK